MQKLLNKLSSIFFQDFYSKLGGNTKNVTLKFLSERILSPFVFLKDFKKGKYFFEFLVIYTLQRKLYKYHRFNSVEKIYVYIYLIFAEMYCNSKEHGKRLNK